MEFTGNSLAQWMARLAVVRSDRGIGATTQCTVPSAFDRAIEHFAHGHWPEAFAELGPLADAGNREAARIAMLLTTRGPRLFGRTFPASLSQRQRWRLVASRVYPAEPSASDRLDAQVDAIDQG